MWRHSSHFNISAKLIASSIPGIAFASSENTLSTPSFPPTSSFSTLGSTSYIEDYNRQQGWDIETRQILTIKKKKKQFHGTMNMRGTVQNPIQSELRSWTKEIKNKITKLYTNVEWKKVNNL